MNYHIRKNQIFKTIHLMKYKSKINNQLKSIKKIKLSIQK